jgi:hypothetical protein
MEPDKGENPGISDYLDQVVGCIKTDQPVLKIDCQPVEPGPGHDLAGERIRHLDPASERELFFPDTIPVIK